MGSEQPIKKFTDVEIQLNHTKLSTLKVTNDPKNPNNRIMQALIGTQKRDYDQWKEKFQNAKPNSQYLLLPIWHQFSSKAMCGTTGSVKMNYENYPYLLTEEMQNRIAKKKRFDETQLWQLLYCLIQAKKQMRNGVAPASVIGDVRPQNVFLNQNGQIKVANLLSWPNEPTNYEKFLENQITYLAPQDIKYVQTSSLDNDSNNLSEVFAIGLTVLSAANLVDYKFLYSNKKQNKFNLQEFNSRIMPEWIRNDIYSDIFRATLMSLLQVSEAERIRPLEIQTWIEQYSADILSQRDFLINNPPERIIRQVAKLAENKALSGSGGVAVGQVQGTSSYYNNNISHQQHQPYVGSTITSSNNYKYYPAPAVINAGNSLTGSTQGLPLQGSRRLVGQRRLPPVTSIPPEVISSTTPWRIDGNSNYQIQSNGYQPTSYQSQNSRYQYNPSPNPNSINNSPTKYSTSYDKQTHGQPNPNQASRTSQQPRQTDAPQELNSYQQQKSRESVQNSQNSPQKHQSSQNHYESNRESSHDRHQPQHQPQDHS